MRTTALRAVPALGWIYLIAGLLAAVAGKAPRNRVLRIVWWIDAFLSIVVHAAQIPAALRAAEGSGRSRIETAVLTQIFGLTWWRTQASPQDSGHRTGSGTA
ncbi:hypothetical protein [Nocardia mexicana]|uniref:hypothetical protein n=1 Tax=Nocardia mexicana TaxID=279262 RepID=UPI001FEBE8DC|nr:hypothetical protein [Nocardia mexicana]